MILDMGVMDSLIFHAILYSKIKKVCVHVYFCDKGWNSIMPWNPCTLKINALFAIECPFSQEQDDFGSIM